MKDWLTRIAVITIFGLLIFYIDRDGYQRGKRVTDEWWRLQTTLTPLAAVDTKYVVGYGLNKRGNVISCYAQGRQWKPRSGQCYLEDMPK